MKEEPLEGDLYYGIEDRSYLDRDPVQPELLPEKLNQLRWKLNREKTQIINLKDEGATLDFLGYSFRYEDDLKGRGWKYLNLMPSKKALEKECVFRAMSDSDSDFCRTGFRFLSDTVPIHIGQGSGLIPDSFGSKSECCPTRIGMLSEMARNDVRDSPE